MKHSLDFFKDEIRNGFYIPTAMKIYWANCLDVLSEIDRICKKHDIRYFADWGSFLGAVRHGGFVPWDDDLDICMIRDDYNRFRHVCDKDLPPGYCIHDYERHEGHWLFLARVVGGSKPDFRSEHLDECYNFPWLASVDIFVRDYTYQDPDKEKKRCDEIMNIIATADSISSGLVDKNRLLPRLRELEQKYDTQLPFVSAAGGDNEMALPIALYRLAEQQMGRVKAADSLKLVQIFPWGIKGNMGDLKEYYESIIRLPFEDSTIPVPACYNKVLSGRYRNYHEIHKSWDGHEYPAFEAQRQQFEEATGARLPVFTYSKELLKRRTPDLSASLKAMAAQSLEELERLLSATIEHASAMSVDYLLEDLTCMQELAINLGTLTENVRGEDDPHTISLVSKLEEFCELIFGSYERYSSGEGGDVLSPLSEALSELEEAVARHIISRREVLFLPIGTRDLDVFARIYEELTGDESADISIMPLPIYARSFSGIIDSNKVSAITDKDLEKVSGRFPKATIYRIEVQPCTSEHAQIHPCIDVIDNYVLSLHSPDTIYIQNPYDGENPYITVSPKYYSSNLQLWTSNLIYVPIGRTAEFDDSDVPDIKNLDYYVCMPGLFAADHVYLQSDNIRKRYMSALMAFTGDKSTDIWEDKLLVKEEYFAPKTAMLPGGAGDPADEGGNIEASRAKNRLLYCIAFYEYAEYTDKLLPAVTNKIKELSHKNEYDSISICFYPDELICTDKELMRKAITSRDKITKAAAAAGMTQVKMTRDNLKELSDSHDSYYGSITPIIHEFTVFGKPVTIADYYYHFLQEQPL